MAPMNLAMNWAMSLSGCHLCRCGPDVNQIDLQIKQFLVALAVGGSAPKAPMDQFNQCPVFELLIVLLLKLCLNPGPGGGGEVRQMCGFIWNSDWDLRSLSSLCDSNIRTRIGCNFVQC